MRGNIQMRFFPVSKTEANCIVKELLKYIQYMDGKINLLILKRYYEWNPQKHGEDLALLIAHIEHRNGK